MENIKIGSFLKKYILNRTTFKILIVIITMITSIPYMHMLLGGYVKIVLSLGLIIIFYEIFNKKYFILYKDKLNILLFTFCCSYLITIIINKNNNFSSNIKALVYMFVFFSLLYMNSKNITYRKLIKEIKLVSIIIICCTFVLSFISFLSYIFSISGHYITDNGFMYYGMFENRLWGLYNPNTGSMLNIISIIFSITFIIEKHKKIFLFILNIILQFCCLILTGSRSALYALFLIIGFYAFIISFKKIRMHLFKKLLTSFIIAAITIVAVIGLSTIVKDGLEYLPSITESIKIACCEDGNSEIHQKTKKNEVVIKKQNLTRIEKVENREGGFLTGRGDIWKAGIKTFIHNPIFGVGRENIYEYSHQYLKAGKWSNSLQIGGLHNIYLTILVSSGLIGFILLSAFCLISIINSCKVLFKNLGTINYWFIAAFAITLSFYITEFVEARILYQVGIFNVIFWIYCGYMVKFGEIYKGNQANNQVGDYCEQ